MSAEFIVPFPTELAFAIAPFIFLPRAMYGRFRAGTLTVDDESVLVHERVHLTREREAGLLVFGARYLFDKKFRLNEELVAIKAQMVYLREHHGVYDIARKARHFSSSTYGFLLSSEEASHTLESLWAEAYTDRR